MITTEDIELAVASIQEDIFESSGGVEYFDISLKTNGLVQKVEFCGITLWSSECDDRTYEDEDDEDTIEAIEQHLRRVLREVLDALGLIKL